MKQTTKILIGVFAASLLLIIAFIASVRIWGEKYDYSFDPSIPNIEQKFVAMDVGNYRAIRLNIEGLDEDEYYRVIGNIAVGKSSNINKLELVQSVADLAKITLNGDTLNVSFLKSDLEKLKKNLSTNVYFLNGMNMKVCADTSIAIISTINGIGVDVKNIALADASFNTSDGRVTVDSCRIANCSIAATRSATRSFIIKNSAVDILDINLDNVGNWLIENSEVRVENLRGGGLYNIQMPSAESKELNWFPKDSDARLNVEFGGDEFHLTYPQK